MSSLWSRFQHNVSEVPGTLAVLTLYWMWTRDMPKHTTEQKKSAWERVASGLLGATSQDAIRRDEH